MLRRLTVLLVLLLSSFAMLSVGGFAQDRSGEGAPEIRPDGPSSRIALVVGQGAYSNGELPTAVNDAGLVAQTLTSAGFEVVQGRDLGANDLRQLVREFLDRVNEATTDRADAAVVVYLSGYGLQIEGDNYFLPVDARIERDSDVPIEGFRISDLIRSLAATQAQTRIVMLDTAREYPLSTSLQPLAGGLALVEPPAGFLIAFSSAPNTVAPEGQPPYGAYASAFVEVMREPGLPVEEVFSAVRLRVHEQTQGQQTPWHESNLQASFVFFEPTEEAAAEAPSEPAPRPSRGRSRRISEVPAEEAYGLAVERDDLEGYQEFLRSHRESPLARRVEVLSSARREAIIWRQTITRNSREGYWTYLRRYPRGPHVEDSRRRLVRLAAPLAPPSDFGEIEYEGLPPPLEFERPYEAGEYVTIIRTAPRPPPPPVYLLPRVIYDERVVFAPPPRALGVGLLPIPVYIPIPVRARPPRFFRPWVAPITPRGAVYVPVRTPFVRQGRFVREDRPDRLPIAVPGQPGLREPIRPIGPRPGRPDRADRPDRPDRPGLPNLPNRADRPDRPDRVRPDRPGLPDRADRPDRPDRPGRPDRADGPDRADRPARPDRPALPERADRPNRPDRLDRPDRPDRAARPDRPERGDRPDRPNRLDGPDRADRPFRPDRPPLPDRADRPVRPDRPDRPDRPERLGRPDRPALPEGPGRADRPERLDRPDRAGLPDRPGLPDRAARPDRPDRLGRPDAPERPARTRPGGGFGADPAFDERPNRPGRGQGLGPAGRAGPADIEPAARAPGRPPRPAAIEGPGGPGGGFGGGGRLGPRQGPGADPIERGPGGPPGGGFPGGGFGRQGGFERPGRARPIERPERAAERPDRAGPGGGGPRQGGGPGRRGCAPGEPCPPR